MSKKSTEGGASKKRARRSQRAEPSEQAVRPARNQAPYAVTSDGTLLLNVDALDPLDAAALEAEGRTLFVGTELRGREASLARELIDNAGHDLRSKIAGSLTAPREAAQRPTSGVK